MGEIVAAELSFGDACILGGVALLLTVSMTVAAARGMRQGPVRALASVLALVASLVVCSAGGAAFGRLLFDGTQFPWLLREAAGTLLLGSLVWLAVFGWAWWRGRSKGASGEPESPVSGAIVGCWVGIAWFGVALAFVLALAGMGEAWASARGRAPALLRWPVRVKSALAAWPGTEPLARFDLVPERPRRILDKALRVLRDPKAFRRLQADDSVRAIAAHPSFYPLASDSELREMVRRHDAVGLLSHPRVLALIEDESFQRRLAETDLESLLDRALAGPAR